MIELAKRPRFYSDFDGTAVRKYGYKNPRNWLKYPLPVMPGYLEFVAGMQESGVDLDGVVTIRKEFWRRRVTNRSIRKLGYAGVIDPGMVNYAGTEEAKGRFIAERTGSGAVAMVDDKPQKLGIAVLNAVDGSAQSETIGRHPLLLGVVAHDRSLEHIEELVELAEASRGDFPAVVGRTDGPAGEITVTKGPLIMHVTQLGPYSHDEGMQFGQKLIDLAAARPETD